MVQGKLERKVLYMEEYQPEEEGQETSSDQVKRWFQDNLRIVISIVIVVLIAGGIYSYSKRTQAPTVSDQSVSTENITDNTASQNTDTNAASSSDQKAAPSKVAATPSAASQETEASFVETASKGDSATVLARRALANYLEKNADSQLTKEHKIYIEDYLRKNVSPGKHVGVGTSIEFSKDTIAKAITQSKTLTPPQLNNLKKYSARVTSLQ